VNLYRDGKPQHFYVHRLVAEAFIGPIPEGFEVNHKDGCKTNANADNLEIVTARQNIQHAIRLGLMSSMRGSRGPGRSSRSNRSGRSGASRGGPA
jgi:hypothetical protein